MNTVGVSNKSINQVLIGTMTSTPPIRIRSQDIGSPRGSVGPQKGRNAHPFKTSINKFYLEHGHPMPISSSVICSKTVPEKSADVYARKIMGFGSNSVVTKSPNLIDFGLSPANTLNKIKSGIVPTTRVGRSTNVSDWHRPRNDIEEVTAKIGSVKKRVQRIYFKK